MKLKIQHSLLHEEGEEEGEGGKGRKDKLNHKTNFVVRFNSRNFIVRFMSPKSKVNFSNKEV